MKLHVEYFELVRLYYSRKQMSTKELQTEILRATAVESVLKSLGDGSLEIIEQYLFNVYGMSVQEASESSHSFEQLMEALGNLLGHKSAEVIFENILMELDQSVEICNLITNEV